MTNLLSDTAVRVSNAYTNFLEEIMIQFNKTNEEAKVIINILVKHKIIKIDVHGGRYSVTHGMYWDVNVMDNALKIASGELVI